MPKRAQGKRLAFSKPAGSHKEKINLLTGRSFPGNVICSFVAAGIFLSSFVGTKENTMGENSTRYTPKPYSMKG